MLDSDNNSIERYTKYWEFFACDDATESSLNNDCKLKTHNCLTFSCDGGSEREREETLKKLRAQKRNFHMHV